MFDVGGEALPEGPMTFRSYSSLLINSFDMY